MGQRENYAGINRVTDIILLIFILSDYTGQFYYKSHKSYNLISLLKLYIQIHTLCVLYHICNILKSELR